MGYFPPPLVEAGPFSPATAADIVPCGPPQFSNPFPTIDLAANLWTRAESAGAFILDQEFCCRHDSFLPTALDTPHVYYTDFYLTAESERQELGGGMVKFTRRYCKIPAAWNSYESFAWSRPGLSGATASPIIPIQSVTYDSATNILTVDATGHGLIAGDTFAVFYTNPLSALLPVGTYLGTVIAVTNANEFTSSFLNPGGASLTASALQKVTNNTIHGRVVLKRDPRTLPVPSTIVHEYFLPGVTPGIAVPKDIPILPGYTTQIVNGNLEETQILDWNSTPTVGDYVALITAQEQVVGSDSILEIWMGNILARHTRYVSAQ